MTPDLKDALKTVSNFLDTPECRDACLDIHQFQGLIAAVSSCPEYVSEVDLAYEVMGDCTEFEERWFEEGELRTAWIICLNGIDEALALETFSLAELYPIDESMHEPPAGLSAWCDGYLRGYLLAEAEWIGMFEFLVSEGISEIREEHEALLSMLVAFEDWGAALVANKNPERLKQGFPEIFRAVDASITRFHKLGLLMEENRLGVEQEAHTPYVREASKVGRNDPCPCGSGKKYKKCCLH